MPKQTTFSCNEPIATEKLQRLYAQTDWAETRSVESIEIMLRHTSLHIGAWCERELIGFARALTDGIYRAVIEDVIVDRTFRGQGIGQELMRQLMAQLADVEEIYLSCVDELIPFYEGLGFRRITHPYMHRLA